MFVLACALPGVIAVLAAPQEDPMETRVYNVEFLTARIEDFPGTDLGLPAEEPVLGIVEAQECTGLLAEEELVKLIRNNIAEDTWEHVQAGLSVSDGVLTVTNRRSVHEKIAQYLSHLRGALGRIVVLDAAVVSMEPEFMRRFRAAGLPDRPAVLTPEQMRRLQAAAREGRQVQFHRALRVTAHPGQRVNLQEIDRREYLKDYDVEIASAAAALAPVVDAFTTGIRVDVRPYVEPFADAVTLEVRTDAAEGGETMERLPRLLKEIACAAPAGLKDEEGEPKIPGAQIPGPFRAGRSECRLQLPAVALDRIRTALTIRSRETAVVGSTFRGGRHVLYLLTSAVVPVEEKIVPAPVFEEQRLLKLYDISPLTRRIPDFPGPRLLGELPPIGASMTLGEPAVRTRSEDIVAMIRHRIAPDTWNNRRNSIEKTDRGTLVVRQRPEVHREIERFLSTILMARAQMITTEVFVLGFRPEARAEWEAQISGLGPGGYFLSKDDFERLLETASKGEGVRLLEAAEVTGFPQQRIHVYRGRQEAYLANYRPTVATGASLHDPAVGTLLTGFLLDVRAHFFHGHEQVAVEFRGTWIEAQLGDVDNVTSETGPLQLPRRRVLRWEANAICIPGKVTVLAIETVGQGDQAQDVAVLVRARPNILR